MLELINALLAKADLTTPEGCRRVADELVAALKTAEIGDPILIVPSDFLSALEMSPRARVLWPRHGVDTEGHVIFPIGPAGTYGPLRLFLDPHATRIAVAITA
ncbi:hypothetical protein UFOVP1476_52 [uncultured Caudovirales phage]|jgi:hypothetical protein|uniref:Uncharacterized protein n=1 Tax=uncultured Caudovirales phage TaxID=2100421 RepID=A0A6J5S4A5_9CAUD|nr:hypothetical protein UFOVP944_47 [uncultured Caudovirales phage]CAB4203298.1 hypothetical protein UFOVP1381_26 [uncultured Caudovirales phage]CAB4216137.1 hypothetical protein UFOVP1476_52 [uncultured Caudovirales phage]